MHGPDLTFEFLSTTPNQAAAETLALALSSDDESIRIRCISAMIRRGDGAAASTVLRHWNRVDPASYAALRDAALWLTPAVAETLTAGVADPDVEPRRVIAAIEMASSLDLTSVVGQLIALAESGSPQADAAANAVIQIVTPLGSEARADRGVETVRSPISALLLASVGRFADHGRVALIDAYLSVASWGDSSLRSVTDGPVANDSGNDDSAAIARAVVGRLRYSPLPAITELRLGFCVGVRFRTRSKRSWRLGRTMNFVRRCCMSSAPRRVAW